MDEVATAARHLGANWSSGNISAIEKGKGRATLQNLLILTYALGRVNGRQVRPTELLESLPEWIDVGVGRNMTTDGALSSWWKDGLDPLSGIPPEGAQFINSSSVEPPEGHVVVRPSDYTQPASKRVTTTDERLAKSMGLPPEVFRWWSERLWGRGFEDERDDRAGNAATAQKKGRVSRTMKDEMLTDMRSELKKDGDDAPR